MTFILTFCFSWIGSLLAPELELDTSIVRDQLRKEVNTKMAKREYFKVSELAEYSGISDRTLWDLLKDPVNPIPHYRIGAAGRIVRVRRSEFNDWMKRQRADKNLDIDKIVDEIFTNEGDQTE